MLRQASYYVAPPSPEMAGWVECFWELAPGNLATWEEQIPAQLSTDLVFSLGTAYQHSSGNGSTGVSGHHCLGVRRSPERFVHRASNHLVGIRLKPGAAARLLRRGGADLRGRSELGGACFGQLSEVMHRVAARNAGRHCRPLIGEREVQAAFREMRKHWRLTSTDVPRVSGVLEIMRQERLFRVRALCERLGVTERTLERLFQAEVGVSPKFAVRVVRLQLAQCQLRKGTTAARVACRLGFFDQAHLCNEHQALAGTIASAQPLAPTVCRISPRRPAA